VEEEKMKRGWNSLALLTDLYELTMAASYYHHRMFAPATFSLFIRDYPPHRGYFVSAGLEDVLDFLESFHFTKKDIEFLKETELFSQDFLKYLSRLRFTGDVHGIPEGRLFFKDEPVLEITGPIIEAQLVETFVINAINLQVSIATKASRCVHASRGQRLVDFSLRRTQGIDAGLKVARASYLAGFVGTSNVMAGMKYDIPIFGTMAHSYITSFEEEIDAFRSYAETFPNNTVLLIDTYDTLSGAHKAATVGKEMLARGQKLKGVRLDSGDMAALSQEVRPILSEAGLDDVSIFASGGFDEYKIARMIEKGGEIDAFGVGTKMGVSADAPYTDMAYKLVKYDGRPVLKLSSGKKTLVDEKQVFRMKEGDRLAGDMIALRNESLEGEPVLRKLMRKGRRMEATEPLPKIKERFQKEFAMLDEEHRRLEDPSPFPVRLSCGLKKLQEQVIHEVREKELGES
jgi:nicotinate phosphoribosyltransferase